MMPILRTRRITDNFTLITNDIINDPQLSLKAKGLLVYLLSKPDDWNVSTRQLSSVLGEGRVAITSAMKELVRRGYARMERPKGENGLFSGTIWIISDTPMNDEGTEMQVSCKSV